MGTVAHKLSFKPIRTKKLRKLAKTIQVCESRYVAHFETRPKGKGKWPDGFKEKLRRLNEKTFSALGEFRKLALKGVKFKAAVTTIKLALFTNDQKTQVRLANHLAFNSGDLIDPQKFVTVPISTTVETYVVILNRKMVSSIK